MRTLVLVPFGLMLSATAYAGPTGPCPASVTDDVQAPAGGSAPVEHRFKDVAFYEGDPKDKDDVPSDDDSAGPRKLDQRWELTRAPGKPITMVCRYHGTNKTVVDVVPLSITSCTLEGEMDAHGEILGSPMLTCK